MTGPCQDDDWRHKVRRQAGQCAGSTWACEPWPDQPPPPPPAHIVQCVIVPCPHERPRYDPERGRAAVASVFTAVAPSLLPVAPNVGSKR